MATKAIPESLPKKSSSDLRKVRVRPSGRTKHQQEQKEETRSRLLKAAAAVFASRSYAVSSVDDIVALAEVGRSSFYRHFDSKWAIASALCESIMPAAARLWKELADQADPSETGIAKWLERRIRLYSDHRAIFAVMKEAVAIEPAGMAAVTKSHDDVINVLAAGIPAFRFALGESRLAQEVRLKAFLLLMQLDEFNYLLAVRGWDIDHSLAIKVMAGQFRHFIEEVADLAASQPKTAPTGTPIALRSKGRR